MGRLTYGMNVSLDGYVRDADGRFDWTDPPLDQHEHFNEIQRRSVVDVYGRHMWEAMRFWHDTPTEAFESPTYLDFAEAWLATDHVVVSRTLTETDVADVPRTTLWAELDLDRVRELVEESDGDVSISGPTLAAAALHAGIVAEVSAYVVPHVAGGGLRFMPEGYSAPLRLRSERRWPGGTVELVYDVLAEDGRTS